MGSVWMMVSVTRWLILEGKFTDMFGEKHQNVNFFIWIFFHYYYLSFFKRKFAPLWSCRRLRGWCRVPPWRDTRQPATPAPAPWFCDTVKAELQWWKDETPPPPGWKHSPGILVVEAQSDLVDTARVGHDQVEARLRGVKMRRSVHKLEGPIKNKQKT